MLSKGDDSMPRSTSSDPLYAVQGRRWTSMLDIIRVCVLAKGHDGMPILMLFNRVFFQWAIRSCYTQHRPAMCNVQVEDDMSRPTSSDCVCCLMVMMAFHPNILQLFVHSKVHEGMICMTLFDRVYCPREMMSCDAGLQPTVCVG